MILLITIGYILTFFTHYNLRSDDLNVYIPYITHLFEGSRLGGQYDFQGFYWVLAFVNKVFYKLLPTSSILPLGLIVTFSSLVLFVMLLMTFIYLKKWFIEDNKKDIWLYYAVGLYTLSQFWYIAYPSYGNTFRRLSVVWVLLSLMYYLKKPTWKGITFLTFFFLTLVNFSSTGIFLSLFLLYSFSHLFAYLDEKDMWLKLWILSIPFSIWSILFSIHYLVVILSFHVFMTILFLTRSLNRFEYLWKEYHHLVLVITPFVFWFLSTVYPNRFGSSVTWINFFTNPEYEMLIHYLRFDFSTLRYGFLSLTNIIFWLSILVSIVGLKHIKNRSHQSIIYLFMVLILTFFNPWVDRYVITNFTNLAYFRIYDIFFNPLSTIVVFSVVLSFIKDIRLKLVTNSLIVLSLLFGIINSDLWPYLDFSGNTDPIHHVSKDELEVMRQLEEYVDQENIEEPINIVVQIYGAHLLTHLELNRQTSQRIDNIDELFSKTDDDAKLNQIFMIKTNELQYGNYVPSFNETCTLLQKIDTQIVVVEAQYNWDVENGLGYCAEKIFEVGDYRVFRMRYEWLEWYK